MAEVSGKPATSAPSDYGERARDLSPVYRSAITALSWGFRLGATLLTIGLLVAAIKGEALERRAKAFPDILPAVLDGKANGIVDLAILCLMATPVATVLTVALGFFRIGDRRYGVLSLFVLGVLAISISLSLFR
ncbi:MAG: hypothetical protein QOF01_3709 [Thermomicrobiales bacterium]|jgi:uncharacterized membrane protein|nr:hypothetical protein [Thermomicrobiales bacterium]